MPRSGIPILQMDVGASTQTVFGQSRPDGASAIPRSGTPILLMDVGASTQTVFGQSRPARNHES